jgi:hypothetical protein
MLSSNTSAANGAANYIEDVFSTYLYTGNGSTQTITNGIDLAGKGGLVWIKSRQFAYNHSLTDTARGVNQGLASNTTSAQVDYSGSGGSVTAFNSTGFSLGSRTEVNDTGTNVSWTFRKQPKFFDVVTWTGNGLDRTIAHSLGSVPGCVIVKCTSAGGSATYNWVVWHRSLASNEFLQLNTTDQVFSGGSVFNTPSVPHTSTTFSVGTNAITNQNGQTYVAYLFAHNAGGFGLTGTDNVISCGSFTSDSNGRADVNLGYEPQFVTTKVTNITGNWETTDVMRGLVAKTGIDNTGSANVLFPNLFNAETADADNISVTPTGFYIKGAGISNTYIYIAIRRGPMKVPTTGTSVLGLNARSGTGANATVTGSAGVSDAVLVKNRGAAVASLFSSRLTGTGYLVTSTTAAEVAAGTTILQANPWDVMDGVKVGTTSTITNASGNTFINYAFRRAPGFMDVCCYTGTGSARTVAHNLAAVPELMIVKRRDSAGDWPVWNPAIFAIDSAYITLLNSTIAVSNSGTSFNSTAPTSTVFTVGTNANTNASGGTYVSYLFATCPGVSKVGSYTGTGTTQTINCGFTGGARFVLIKRIASAGGAPAGADWYVWDSARGIVSGNDPYLLLNSTAAEVTNTDYVDTYSAGFEISSTAPAEINASGGTFIFLAIA